MRIKHENKLARQQKETKGGQRAAEALRSTDEEAMSPDLNEPNM